jgi:hypothetical protein
MKRVGGDASDEALAETQAMLAEALAETQTM